MIERKRGHIVAIASLASKVALPYSTIYCSTKFGVDGFMRTLGEEISFENHDFIKLTTVFPYFINTRKELSDIMDFVADESPRLMPSDVADEIVEGIKLNKEQIMIPKAMVNLTRLFE